MTQHGAGRSPGPGRGRRRLVALLVVILAALGWMSFTERGGGGEESADMAGVTVAVGVLDQGEPWIENGVVTGRTTSPAFLISPGNDQAAVDAVLAAATRFYAINEFGHEMARDDPHYYDHYTPSWVGAYQSSAGVALLADTKGDLPLVQGEAMVAVLVEELSARDVTAHIDALPQGLDLGDDITA